jgi:hypothetical protein
MIHTQRSVFEFVRSRPRQMPVVAEARLITIQGDTDYR